MNYTTIPKSICQLRTGNGKPTDIYVWATIKCKSDYKTQTSHITEDRLSQITGVNIRTVKRSVQRLKECGAMQVTTRIIDGCKRRNSYYIANPQTDFYFVDNRFFTKNHPPKIAGFLLLLKAICLNNTNTILWNIGQIADAVGMNRNTVSALIKESSGLGLIKALPNGYEITDDCFINPPQKDTAHAVYNEICRFCITKGTNPPQWNERAMNRILTKYNIPNLPIDNPLSVTYAFNERCKMIPQSVSLAYFVKVLCTQDPIKANKLHSQSFLLT